MRTKWSNRMTLVRSYLRAKRLKAAQDAARDLLSADKKKDMLLHDEVEFLKLVIKAKTIKDIGK